jgi:hypothetical protein
MQAVKPQAERLKEAMEILNKLKLLGVKDNDVDYKELSGRFNEWIKMGPAWTGTINFFCYNRKAKVVLPTKPNTTAKCDFLHHVFHEIIE